MNTISIFNQSFVYLQGPPGPPGPMGPVGQPGAHVSVEEIMYSIFSNCKYSSMIKLGFKLS